MKNASNIKKKDIARSHACLSLYIYYIFRFVRYSFEIYDLYLNIKTKQTEETKVKQKQTTFYKIIQNITTGTT